MKIGITERGDASLTIPTWKPKLKFVDGAILITKCLSDEFINAIKHENCIVHATVTGWGGSALEPNVPTTDWSRDQFNKLRDTISHERIVLRIDPIIMTDAGISRALYIKDTFDHDRLRISFLDLYPHVKQRLNAAKIKTLQRTFHAPLNERKTIAALFKNAEICGEPGMECTGCISSTDLSTLGLPLQTEIGSQRKDCKCLAIKTELLNARGQCAHKCLYCYWK